MPASVANAAPATVMPNTLCRQFTAARTYAVLQNEYRDGGRQVALRGATSRKTWAIAKRLTKTEVATLRAFFLARLGATEPFYFYDLLDDKQAVFDATGVNPVGRFTVRFDGGWSQAATMGRVDVSISLVELT
jgi:hypothetical protein